MVGVPEQAGSSGMRLLVVDDHRIFAEVLANHLRQDSGVNEVETAFSIDEAKAVLNRFSPQVVLLDNDVHGERGTALIPELVRMHPRAHVVMLSATSDSDTIIEALEAGAEAWVGKDSGVDVLLLAAHEVMRGNVFLYPTTLKPVIRRLLDRRRGATEPTFVDQLSPRELEVLRCLVSGLTRAEVARRLFISPNTVRTHVQHLLQRAEVHSTVALVAAARGAGVDGIDHPSPGIPEQRRQPSI